MEFREREQEVLQKWGWDLLGATTEEEACDVGRWLHIPVQMFKFYGVATYEGVKSGFDNGCYVGIEEQI